MWLIVGLGNPGPSYTLHRHNVGFQVVDALRASVPLPLFSEKKKLASTCGTIGSHQVILAKPLTYMNLSGPALCPLLLLHKLAPPQIIVIHDELDLPPGQVRLKHGGGAGGHNGLRSLIDAIGPDFLRIRIGIGHPGVRERVSEYVLSAFLPSEQTWLAPLKQHMVTAFPLLLEGQGALFLQHLKNP
jgi:PTH1 family peptidyl-tRNA hydrolase